MLTPGGQLSGLTLSCVSIRVLDGHCYLSVSLSVLNQNGLLSVSAFAISKPLALAFN